MSVILNMKATLEKNFRLNQQIFRNKKIEFSQNLNEKKIILNNLKERIINFDNDKKIIKTNQENHNKKKNFLLKSLEFVNDKILSEDFSNSKKNILIKNKIIKNEFILSLCKNVFSIILEENRIPDIKIVINYVFSNNIQVSNFSIKSNENKIKLNLDKTNLKNSFNNSLSSDIFIDESFTSLETILKINSRKLAEKYDFNGENTKTIKEKILNILEKLINIKEKEMFFFSNKLKIFEQNIYVIIEKLNRIKSKYLQNIESLNSAFNLKEAEIRLEFINKEEILIEKKIKSILDDIKYYNEYYKKEEYDYKKLVERTKLYVKAINQIKKYMINNFSNLKDYLISRKKI